MRKHKSSRINKNYIHNHALYDELANHQDALFIRYSKLLMLRIDLAYLDDSISSRYPDINATQIDIAMFIQQVKEIPSVVGYAWVLENGLQHGLHVHCVIYIDGQKHRKTWLFSSEISDVWKSVTSGDGYAHRCQPNPKYKKQGERVTAWNNSEGRDDMLYILSYLSKQDQKLDKLIYRCSAVPPKGLNRGRKRNKSSDISLLSTL
ncbi:inovirus-type Gp2 protein [Plesiomonas shigelloides]|uniref:YagK/YfjJ domain-containing protein n=1 Tax=Plesiomonas shigelloides TaxID=703 RepID=UPI00057B4732|nr:inovirus-type Gp2 protein [Plesiomonas shigelloides]